MNNRTEIINATLMAGAGIVYFVIGTFYITSKVFTSYNLTLM